MDRKKIQGIPKSNIKPMTNQTTEQSFEIKSFHKIPRLVLVKSTEGAENQSKTSKNKPLNSLQFNTSVKNKNLLSFSGLLILALDFILIAYFIVGSRRDWITLEQAELCFYLHVLCAPLMLPMIYFMRSPKHLVVNLN